MKAISRDFQGWPIYALTWREILNKLPFVKNGVIDQNDPRLDIYPRTLEDDGMGYGVNEKLITECSFVDDDKYCNIFIDIDETKKFGKILDE